MDDRQTSKPVEESDISSAEEIETSEQNEATEEESTLVDFQTAVAENREARMQKSMATMREYLTKFQATLKALDDVALKFREQTEVSFRQCREVVKVLQDLRRLTDGCLELFHSGNACFSTSSYLAMNSLYNLDGEKTARLILEVDLFESLIHRKSMSDIGGSESLAHARERIKMHVELQSSLKDETKSLRELIGHLEKMLTEVQTAPALSVQC